MSLNSWGQYANNLLGTLVGKSEGFYDASSNSLNASSDFAVFGLIFLIFNIINLIILIVCLFGAAKLSWCYNTFYGRSEGEKILWSILCFIFAGLYYPYYALFLDPVCGRVAQRGGKK
jgi:hypothetical protein